MNEMKQCPKCNASINETAKYCGGCGFRFQDVMDAEPAAPKKKPEKTAAAVSKKPADAPKVKHRVGLFAVLSIMTVLVLGGFFFFLYEFYNEYIITDATEERGRREENEMADTDEEEEVDEKEHEPAALLGTSLKTDDGEYYFTREGDYYFFISDPTENYIKGAITLRELTKEDVESSEAAGIETAIRNASFYRVDAVVEQELYYGSKRSGNTYTMYIATNGENAAIYDSGWAEIYPAEVGELADRGTLEAHFTKEETATVAVATDTGIVTGTDYSVADIRFDAPQVTADSGYIAAVTGTGSTWYIFKDDSFFGSTLYSADAPGDINHATEFLTVEEGSFIGSFATDDKYLYYSVGHETGNSYSIDAFYRMELSGGRSELIIEDQVEDFVIAEDAIYYTDYSKLVRVDRATLIADTIWEYGVYCFELYEDNIFVCDGEAWEIIDAVDGTEYGYVIDRINYAYECDAARIESNTIFHVAYDYSTEEVAVHAINIESGREYTIGEAYAGTAADTYNVFYDGKYVYFTVNDWEGLARVDVTNGDSSMISFSDLGYYYANEFELLDGAMVLHAYDEQRGLCLLQMDSNMNLTRIW